MIAQKLGFHALASGIEIVPALSGGFGSWEKVSSLGWGIERALGSQIAIGAVFDGDYHCAAQIEDVESELSKSIALAHIHRRKEIENYLLIPSCLDRALQSAVKDRDKRESSTASQIKPIADELLSITEKHKDHVFSQRFGREHDFRKKQPGEKADSATLHSRVATEFNARWKSLAARLELVPGKEVLAELRTVASEKYGVSLSDSRIISSMREEDVPNDFRELLEKLESFRTRPIS
jgi:hypothetical protein